MQTTKLNDGGPAFPSDNYRSDERGMSLRTYFAASAPDAPDWFTPKLTPLPQQPPGAAFCDGCKADQDCHGSLSCIAMKEHRRKEHATRELNKMERLIQWRWVYADQMIDAPGVLTFADAIKIAKGCFDYSGGHRDEARETFHHGIQTVVNALEAANVKGLADTQVNMLHKIGSK